jgi:CRISP-associated protein Cas1
MKQNLYLFSDTYLQRKDNTLLCSAIINQEDEIDLQQIREETFFGEKAVIPTGDKKYIPVETIESIFAFGTLRFNSRLIYFLSQHSLPVHFFNEFNGSYSGSFYPPNCLSSGSVLVNQVEHYNCKFKRLYLAGQFVLSAAKNSIANLKYYNSRGRNLDNFIELIDEQADKINNAASVQELLGIEGIIKKIYYAAWKFIFNKPVDFYGRVKNPPNNMVNALISYGNMIVYGLCLNEIYHSRLYPEIGYLHAKGDSRLPLSYDIAEIFKPVFTDRIIFKLINKDMISEEGFFTKNSFCKIKEIPKKVFVKEFKEKLETTIAHPVTGRQMSYKRVIREECYKLIKHFAGEAEYKPLVMKW